jgi:hypothetical protein
MHRRSGRLIYRIRGAKYQALIFQIWQIRSGLDFFAISGNAEEAKLKTIDFLVSARGLGAGL